MEIQGADNLGQIYEFFRAKVNILIIILICITAVFGTFSYIRHRSAERELTASTLLEEGKKHLRDGDFESAEDYFNSVFSGYSGTRPSEEAALYYARAHIEMGEHDEALNLLEEYLGMYPEGRFLPEAYKELGFINESAGKYEDAEYFYSLVHRNFPQHYLAPQSMLDGARCMKELGKWDEAKGIYETLIRTYPWSASAELALMYLEMVSWKTESSP